MSPEERREVRLLAVDLGLRFGWAAFGDRGRLIAYGSRHFANLSVLRRAVPGILSQHPNLDTLILEGGGALAAPWEKEALRLGIRVRSVQGETWRESLLPPRNRRTGKQAKAAADGVARRVIEQSGAKRPTALRHDAAEAILVGYWASTIAG